MPNDEKEFEQLLKDRFARLPKIVQDAIVSADVSAKLRALAEEYKLHLDQWEVLEHEVRFTLMGLKDADALPSNIKSGIGVPDEVAHALAADISRNVFEPIREELERQLEHPDAKVRGMDSVEMSRAQILREERAGASTQKNVPPPSPTPATPPPPPPSLSAQRSSDPIYLSNAPSHERKSAEGDPYREQLG